MTIARPTSQNFDALANGDLTLPTTIGGLVFSAVSNYSGSDFTQYAHIDTESNGTNRFFQYIAYYHGMNSAGITDGFAIAAANGGTFGLKSIKLDSVIGGTMTVNGYDAQGAIVTTDTVTPGVADSSGSITFTVNTDSYWGNTFGMSFSQAWSGVTKVTFTVTGSNGPFGLDHSLIIDDIVLNSTAVDLASGNDSGRSATDHVTNVAAPLLSGTANAGATLDVFVDGAPQAATTVVTDSGGAFKVNDLGTLLDGVHTVTVTEQGNATATSSVTFTIDTSALPPAALVLDPTSDSGVVGDNLTSDTTPLITGTAEANATVVLYDGSTQVGTASANGAGVWSITADALDDGAHRLTAEQIDVAGNTSQASAALTVTIASGRPSAPVLADASDSGIKGDHLTNVANPTFTGTAQAGAIVTLYDTDHVVVGGVIADAQGNWSIEAHSQSKIDGLLDGTHTLHAEITVGGSSNTAPTTLVGGAMTLQIDTTAPLPASAPVLNKASDSGIAGDNVTSVTTPTLDGHADRNATVAIYDNGTLLSTTSADSEGTWHFQTGSLTAGAHAITVVQSDAAGNAAPTSTPLNLTIDVAAAAPNGLALDPTYAVVGAAANTTYDITPLVTGKAEAHALVTLYEGTTVVGTGSADGDGNWQIATAVLADGVHGLSAQQVDGAGNTSAASDVLSVVVASGRPGMPVLADASDSGVKGDAITKDTTPTLSGTARAGASVALFDGDTLVGVKDADADGHWSITVGDLPLRAITPTALADGVHTLTAAIKPPVDPTSNADRTILYSAPYTLTIDTTAPVAPGAPTLDAASHAGTDNSTTVRTPTLHGQAERNATVAIYDNGTLLGTTTANGEGTWQYQTGRLTTGNHAITTTQTDAAGNVSQAGTALALKIKAEPVAAQPTVDGVAVTTGTTVLAGGTSGTSIAIPVVSAGRVEQSGNAGTADIPLATAGSNALLTAQVHTGFGLNASGATVKGNGLAELIAAIKATGTAHGNSDVGHLTSDGQSFLSQLAADGSLHVQTVQLTGAAQGSAVDLVAGSGDTKVALVVDGTGVAAGTTVTLANIPFASVFGALHVTGSSHGQILSGDSAAQTFTVGADSGGKVLAGGGADTLAFSTAPAAAAGVSADVAPGTTAAVTTTLLHGGSGADTAVFSGNADAYTVEQHNGYVLVHSNAAPDEVAQLVNVESLQFGDKTVTLQATAAQQTLAALYENVLHRQADVYGFDFWAGAEKAGLSLGTIALDMVNSNEGVARFGALNGTAAHDVGIVYEAVFGRAADAAGSAFWVAQMAGGATLAQVTDALAHSAEIVGQQQAATAWDFTV